MRKGDRVLVVGAGPIGAGCMLFAKLHGGSVAALDMRQDPLYFCRNVLGVDHAVAAGADTLEMLSKLTSGDSFDIVIDATGKASAMTAGFDYVAHGGTYVVSVVLDTISFADPKFHARARPRFPAAATRRGKTSSRSSARCAMDSCQLKGIVISTVFTVHYLLHGRTWI